MVLFLFWAAWNQVMASLYSFSSKKACPRFQAVTSGVGHWGSAKAFASSAFPSVRLPSRSRAMPRSFLAST